MATILAGQPRREPRFLLIVRADETSLHRSWLDPAGGKRNWDLHVDYFGSADSVPNRDEGDFLTIGKRIPKWPGLFEAIAAAPYSLEDYDYVGIADDDLVADADSWSRAFTTAHEEGLTACQLSLRHGSFFGLVETLRLPGLKLHYVARVEQMAIIVRTDVFEQLLPFMPLPGNLWAMDHVLAHFAAKAGGRIAVLDNASVLHARRFWVGPAYEKHVGGSAEMLKIESDFLMRHNIPWLPQQISGGLSKSGRPLRNIWWLSLAVLPARALRKLRDTTMCSRIAAAADGDVWLLRRFGGVRVGRVNSLRIAAEERGQTLATSLFNKFSGNPPRRLS